MRDHTGEAELQQGEGVETTGNGLHVNLGAEKNGKGFITEVTVL